MKQPSAAARQPNRAELVDQDFSAAVRQFDAAVRQVGETLPDSLLSVSGFIELFDSQMI